MCDAQDELMEDFDDYIGEEEEEELELEDEDYDDT